MTNKRKFAKLELSKFNANQLQQNMDNYVHTSKALKIRQTNEH